MASPNSSHTTGAGKDEAELRRRNVSSYEKTNGNKVVQMDAEDTKKLQKVPHPNLKLRLLLIPRE